MSNDLVVQLGAKLDQFQSDMNQAGDIADAAVSRIEQQFASLNPGLGGFSALGLSITGITGTVGTLLAALTEVNGQLAQIQKSAAFSNISTDRFQQIQFAAGQGGVDNKQSATDLANVSKLLADAKYNENSLTKILDENNIKYKDRNGQIISLNQLLTIAGGLLGKFDSIPDKTKVAQMLGLSEGWVEALRNGSKSFEDIASKASEAGAVIDAKTIAKAAEFDRAWKASSAQLGAQFKSTLADVSGWFDDLIGKANELVKTALESQNIQSGSGQATFNRWADAADILQKDLRGLPQDVDQVTRAIENLQNSGKPENLQIAAGLELIRAKAQLARDMLKAVAEQQSKSEYPNGVPLPGARPSAADTPTGTGVIPSRKTASNTRDQFDIAVDSITKRTATLKADTAAALENNVAQAQFRAEFQELTAIMRDNGEVTQQQIDKYEELRKTMTAQQALEASGITLTADHAKKFISSSEAIATATASYDKAKKTLTDLNNASSQIGSALSSAFADAVVEGKNLNEVLSGLLKTLEKAAINSAFSSVFNATASGGLSPFAAGLKGIFGFAGGTDFAPGGVSLVGENGPELVNLPRGSQVVPNDVLRSQAGSSGPAITYNINASGADSGTVARIQTVLAAHARAIGAQAKGVSSAQRLQSTGVS